MRAFVVPCKTYEYGQRDEDSTPWADPVLLTPQAFIFDAYGTLFDVHSVVQREQANIAGDLLALSELWRQKQLEYTWLRALMDRYEDFWQITEAALRFCRPEASRSRRPTANWSASCRLISFPAAFEGGKIRIDGAEVIGSPLAILSNGSSRMLDSAVRSNGLEAHFAEIISVDKGEEHVQNRLLAFYALGHSRF